MDIVAGRAGHFAFRHRVVRGFVELGALLFVTGVADLRLRGLGEHLVLALVHRVAGGATNVTCRMLAAGPVDALAALMAGETGAVLRVRGKGFRGRVDDAAYAFAAAGIDVGGAVAVTGRARAGAGRTPRIAFGAVFRGRVALDLGGVAVFAGFRAGAGRLCGARGGHEPGNQDEG